MNNIDSLNKQQKQHLKNAFKAVVSLVTAETVDNHARCACFHIQPFNPKWDEDTVKGIITHIRSYVSTWILYPLSEAIGMTEDEVTTENLIYWHRIEANRLEENLKKSHQQQNS